MRNESRFPAPARPQPVSAKTTLDNFEVHFPIGRGSHSLVFKALHRPSNTVVALKVMEAKTDKDRLRNAREIQLHTPLDHPHVVRLLDSFSDDSNQYLVLEHCAKGEFFPYFTKNRHKFSENDVKKFLFQALSALEYVHGQGVIHRDVKMGNLLLTEQGDIKLADFGLSVTFEERNEAGHESMAGTPNYLPPEFVLKNKISFANDLWSVGCFGFALVYGRLPFEGNDYHETIKNIVGKKLDFGACSPKLERVLSVLLDRRYENRRSARKVLGMDFFQQNSPREDDEGLKIDRTQTTTATEGHRSSLEVSGHKARTVQGLSTLSGFSRVGSGIDFVMNRTGTLKSKGQSDSNGFLAAGLRDFGFAASGSLGRPASLKRITPDHYHVSQKTKAGANLPTQLPTQLVPPGHEGARPKAKSIVKSRLDLKSVLDGLCDRFELKLPRKYP